MPSTCPANSDGKHRPGPADPTVLEPTGQPRHTCRDCGATIPAELPAEIPAKRAA